MRPTLEFLVGVPLAHAGALDFFWGRVLTLSLLEVMPCAFVPTPWASFRPFSFRAAPIIQAAPPANIEMTLPADASVWLDGQATTQTGHRAALRLPPLEVGSRYSYTIRVQWTDGGKTLERSRRVRFESGDHIQINLAHGGLTHARGHRRTARSGAGGL